MCYTEQKSEFFYYDSTGAKRKRDEDSPGQKKIRQSVPNANVKTAAAVNESQKKQQLMSKLRNWELMMYVP